MKRASWLASSTTKHCAAPVSVHPQNDLRVSKCSPVKPAGCFRKDFSRMNLLPGTMERHRGRQGTMRTIAIRKHRAQSRVRSGSRPAGLRRG